MKPFLVRWLVTTFAVFVTAPIVGIRYEGLDTLLAASLLLGVMNAFVRPLLLLLSLPFILATLGFFILVVNALMLEVVSFVLPSFHVPSLGRAFFGSILISLVSWLVSAFFRGSDGKVHPVTQCSDSEMKQVKGRVIR
jgi:putative membrane protein